MLSHLIQFVEMSRHQTDQLTRADFIQDSARQFQCLEKEKKKKGGRGQRSEVSGSI